VGAALVVSTVAAIWLFVGALVPALFGVDFAAAAEVARPLLLASVALAGRRILADAARGAGHPGLGSIAEMVSLAVLVTAALSLASIGEQGVAYAVAVSATVGLAILAVLVARLREPVKVDAPAPVILGEDA
jgi:Na+-driven multidrug efflux pump